MEVLQELFGGSKITEMWQDREIRFDTSNTEQRCIRGEVLLEILDPVEDTKGNNGEQGSLHITNLRLLWVSKKSKRTNISIGFSCVTSITTKAASSRLKGETQALYLQTKYHSQRFEFVFTNLTKSTNQLLNIVQAVFKAYDNSRLYRDLKLRGAFIQDRELKLLPLEQTYSRVNGVWNLSSEQGNLGTFFISNVRVVWYSNLADSFNVSIPYLQMRSVRVRASKFGEALVIETTPGSGSYTLGFKVDPKETLDYVHKEISSLFETFGKQPIFGVECDVSAHLAPLASMTIQSEEEDVVVVDPVDKGDLLAAYYADSSQGTDREPVYCPELGLAVEQLREGTSVEQLWSVL
mmetsp:Transcript_12869/g.22725  ORF Transcript_12869/g.22725 Transcript_12869/m.22725 type:complete len:351 (+) Transcript_12869:249-1301(+)|eukprot:CAMPEP_0119104358 /NCGR_PEP_ID=MMETSP1180-20130426/2583_1 /TAXON_ID=3052 ORGANISM="Chlamydomonas cf sp, Strain CCMP681" /NCGR_SAMPLE_ID=MMETSP1180 /ASSEMBLY_ACC=CAM_ASM_000741 /LENGTH=350 /DNA_ID=CAMNT_0007089085 /DNA_START=231 /DNA_END=1283 /DNA_ORIENTATION=-